MALALLLHREDSRTSLSAIVDTSQTKKPPFAEYQLELDNHQLHLILRKKPDKPPTDEGFESDIDSLSIVSSDDSYPAGHAVENANKTTETDSANGSASSDSDTEPSKDDTSIKVMTDESCVKESYNLVDCVCYTDVKLPDILVFVLKKEVLVFRFEVVRNLLNFYTNFTALKAVTNQKAYSKCIGAKFNLLQRTDVNGVTHIEIARSNSTDDGPSSVVSLVESTENRKKENNIKAFDHQKSSSSDNLLNINSKYNSIVDTLSRRDSNLRKVWKSAENILDAPKKPERRKRVKPKAPQPPTKEVKVTMGSLGVDESKQLIVKSQTLEPHPKKLQSFKPNLNFLSRPKTLQKFETSTLTRTAKQPEKSWTNSVPRPLKQHYPPMSYRYIDTTNMYSHYGYVAPKTYPQSYVPPSSTISNRLFGLSGKLRDFSGNSSEIKKTDTWKNSKKLSKSEGNLKSVIKKDESRKKNDKKVTFSAYTTVQVL